MSQSTLATHRRRAANTIRGAGVATVRAETLRPASKVGADPTGVLEQVKAYHRADPHFKLARARLVEAEARGSRSDPVEGVVVDVEPSAGKRRPSKF